MEKRRWLIAMILMSLLVLSAGRELKLNSKYNSPTYNHTLARILVEYSSAVSILFYYRKHACFRVTEPMCCGVYVRFNRIVSLDMPRCDGLTKGFEMIELIVDVQHCLQAFVGVAKNLNAIVIAFRGTQENSIQNWVSDLFWKQLDCNYPGISDGMVHHGFYSAYHNTTLRPEILSAVKSAKELYGDLQIMVTGHSMGGAMAAFCGLDLKVNIGMQNVQVMTFGQPRIGNAAFSSYYIQEVPNTIRVTNEHDMVPHLPPYYTHFPQKTYHHFPREVWVYHIGFGSLVYRVEKICDGSGEDPTCSRSVSGNSISDHLEYFGVEMGCDAFVTCKMVMDPRLAAYSTHDQSGNFIVSMNRFNSIMKTSEEAGVHSSN